MYDYKLIDRKCTNTIDILTRHFEELVLHTLVYIKIERL